MIILLTNLFALPAADFSGNSVSSIIVETFVAPPSAVISLGAQEEERLGPLFSPEGGFLLRRDWGVAILPLNITYKVN